jgi:3-deoxy-manno-octulosonate cytidylyltransferase (CMP-KDO synthetase)
MIIGVIPARLDSSRLYRKVLIEIEGKTLLEWVYLSAIQSKSLDKVIIAVDDDILYKTAKRFCEDVYLTSKACKSGTDRVAEIISKKFNNARIILNIQADQLAIHPSMLDEIVYTLLNNKNFIDICTLITPIYDEQRINDPNVVKVVADNKDFALYFSRLPIPYNFKKEKNTLCYYKHIGIYGYTKDSLLKFVRLNNSKLEAAESLEQLRALEFGFKIKLIKTKYDTIEINTKEELLSLIKENKWRQNIYL